MFTATEIENILENAGLVAGLTSTEVCRRLEEGVETEELSKRRVAFYLVEMDEHLLYQDAGFNSTVAYAEHRLKLDPRRARERIALGRKLLTLPLIDAAFCKRLIGWTKLLMLVRVATPECEAAWLALALQVDCAQLALEVKSRREGQSPRKPGDRKGLSEVRFKHASRVDAVTHQLIEQAKCKLSEERGVIVTEKDFLRIAAEIVLGTEEDGSVAGRKRVGGSLYRLVLRPGEEPGELLLQTDEGTIPVYDDVVCCDAETVVVEDEYPEEEEKGTSRNGKPKKLAPKTPPKLREEILTAAGCRCCCCGTPYSLTVHHIEPRSEGGETRGANGSSLCNPCHALVHTDLLVVEGHGARHARFLDQNGRPLHDDGEFVDPEVLAELRCLVEQEPEAPPVEPRAQETTLETAPDVIDGAWWRRHANLISIQEGKGLELRPGLPRPESKDAQTSDAELEKPVPEVAFAGLVGQDVRIDRIRSLAKGGEETGDGSLHILFQGPPGTGKTRLARGVAAMLGTRLHVTTGPLLQDTHSLIRILAELGEGDVLFIDEVHAVPRKVLEVLYEAMSERRLSLTLHDRARTRTIRLALPTFSFLAATTRGAMLDDALKSRFLLHETLGWYTNADLAALLEAEAHKRGFELTEAGAQDLAWYARGTPREALRLLECLLRRAAGEGSTRLGFEEVHLMLDALGYDEDGLKPEEQAYVKLLRKHGRPMSRDHIARALGTTPTDVEQVLEPYPYRLGLVHVTPRGREAVGMPHLRAACGV